MPVLRLTEEELEALYMVNSSSCDWTKAQWQAYESLQKKLRELKRINIKQKLDTDKVWEALKGVVG